LIIDIVDIDIADNPLLIDNENGSFRVALGTKNAILFGYSAMRPKVTQQRVIYPSQAIGPRF
jgi:hypothetical protein